MKRLAHSAIFEVQQVKQEIVILTVLEMFPGQEAFPFPVWPFSVASEAEFMLAIVMKIRR
jgi:hypothetical protein